MKQRKIQLASPNDCTACAACVSVCPKQCITMQEDKEGFLQPKIDSKQCILCHKCEKTCPILTPAVIPNDFETKAYAVINRDEDVRAQSSSGGVFFPLAQWVIEQGGVVFGAKWNDKWEVEHAFAEDIEGVKQFMKSKYVQSVVGDTLRQAKVFLDEGRWVLYSGTPCQLGGLRAYLGKDYDKLIQVDLICHGVPSPGVWRSYLKDYIGKDDYVLDVNFRDKCDGWLGFQVKIVTACTTRIEGQMENPYFRGFLQNVYLRNSCYECKYKQSHRLSDITLADYWGVNELCPKMYDNRGTSAVLIHSNKGECLLRNVAANCSILEQKMNDVSARNSMISASVSKPTQRKYFFMTYFLGGEFKKYECFITKNLIFARFFKKIKKLLH